MIRTIWQTQVLALLLLLQVVHAQPFVNFETAPVHPVALSSDGKTLAVCNLPDSCVELFDLTQSVPRPIGSIFTGLDPVTARFNNLGELWVINGISDSISIIDPATQKVLATLDTFDAPADVIFTSRHRAFVSHAGANVVQIWDVTNRTSVGSIDIDGDRPKAMALSPDESEIYVAILESGNGSTIIAPALTALERTPQPSAAELPESPQHGLNPFPNLGAIFSPVINTNIPATNLPPRVSLIVRKQQGRWMDDNKGDWTQYISGTNSFLTGRLPGWDTADHDIAIINTTNGAVRYIRSLMNICFDLSVNPSTGQIALIGTDAINEVRFEPVLKSIFIRMKLALVDPVANTNQILDLNPHLDYKAQTLPAAERLQTVGDPRAIAWNSRGTRAYVTGMGSDNLISIDQSGARIGSAAQLPEGPTGIIVDDNRNRLYLLSRFANKLVTVNTDTLAIIDSRPLHDPTPTAIRVGRKHFYNTQKNSGLGQAACASCHVDGRFDRLAWDLGDPTGELLALTNRFSGNEKVTGSFHPMKGPMVTQTLVDIIGHEPFHWRGDKDGIEGFNATFMALQGADSELTDEEMQEFEDFLASLTFPPNRRRNLDNSLPTSVRLFNETSLGRGALEEGQRLPDGSAVRGVNQFLFTHACTACHTFPTGLGVDGATPTGLPIVSGPNGEKHHRMIALPRSSTLPFKVPQLRDMPDKLGFNLRGPISRAGFGFMHDGRVDSLTRFVQDSFAVTDDQETADLIALLLAFSGSDFTKTGGANNPIGPLSHDAPAGVGLQASLTNSVSNSRLIFMMAHARSSTSRVDLVVHAIRNGTPRSWLLNGQVFNADKTNENATVTELLQLATPASPVTFTFVPRGSGSRIALDRDGDTFFNQDEIDAGSDPADPAVTPLVAAPRMVAMTSEGSAVRIQWNGRIAANYRVQVRRDLSTNSWADLSELITVTSNPASWSGSIEPDSNTRFYRIVHVP